MGPLGNVNCSCTYYVFRLLCSVCAHNSEMNEDVCDKSYHIHVLEPSSFQMFSVSCIHTRFSNVWRTLYVAENAC